MKNTTYLLKSSVLKCLGKGSSKLMALSACILMAFVPFADAAERTLIALLEGDEIYPTLNISATGQNGSRTSIDVGECPDLEDKIWENAFRFEIEFIMICNVVRDNDIADRIEFGSYPNPQRGFEEVRTGRADMFAESVFQSAVPDEILVTDPVLRLGEFKVGIFTSPNRSDVLGITTADQLRALRGLTVGSWAVDLKTLQGMGLDTVITARKHELVPTMIDAGRADFTLSYLDRPVTDHMGARLVRVDGFRVSLADERVLAFSPSNTRLVELLNTFIRDSRSASEDRIRIAYEKAGFIVDQYDHWQDVTSLPD